MLSVGAGAGMNIFLSSIVFLFLTLSLRETARYRRKYYLKRPLNSKQQQKLIYFSVREAPLSNNATTGNLSLSAEK